MPPQRDKNPSSGDRYASRLYKIPFTFDSPGLLTGEFEAYTPKVGEFLMDAWFEITEAWDGTTPKGDIGAFTAGQTVGLFEALGDRPIGMNEADAVVASGTILAGSTSSGASMALTGSTAYNSGRAAPSKLTTVDPLCICVSQDATPTGADPESTQGAATLYLLIMTPREV